MKFTGRVVQINLSDGGVPKLPVSAGEVTLAGLEGDRQRDLKFHGGPDRALCLWSLEVIELLQQEGHPIAPGHAGENLTLAGIDWANLAPGSQLQLGNQVLVEITDYAAPCRTLTRWFSDRRFSRISQKHHPGSSRLYARVLRGGLVSLGDRAIVQVEERTT
ncbi:MOSC domain-containing protein [Leptolyngbya sp. CCNP1308]|uniref:MOSC domain-containing protein n=1 Tax=Leptolyngbya sp. CCNP1308 TaxID=3110255 RepID=UPI002B1FD55D|nr:MOSC domain-containing protein [Leptolyngbya sp. CCNP1308]MEA5450741.1 MOSC domain-containing protein [Leptolyngbya sp. CCNP1308]